MRIYKTAQETLLVGKPLVVEGPAPEGALSAVFEDDGETGYFYALDTSLGGQPIQDAVHIYNVADVADRDKPSEVKIGWAEGFQSVVLLINDHPHAVFSFPDRKGWCRTGFPPPAGEGWSIDGHGWDEAALKLFA
jgi:hypothetical protein